MKAPTRPILRYFGGKWRLAPWIISGFPPHRIYCEPFGGGASVLLQKSRAYGEIYNDLDGEIVNVFRVMQKYHRTFRKVLQLTPFAKEEYELAMTPSEDPVEKARRTIVRSFMGFGSDSATRDHRSGFRNNSNRSGTTPAHDWASWPRQIDAFHERLTGVVIENRDALAVMDSQDCEDTLHYVDPPYVHATRRGTKSGYRFEMNDVQHEALLVFLSGLKGMVVLSGYDHPIYQTLKWENKSIECRIFHKGDAPGKRTETIWMNPAAVKAQAQQSFF